ncbi:G-type lectin S-receptor-like serine/threonine-protein kinase At2g19130 [Mangifera indica]|uniref:G-type lectin S-receptor-like serine/threonine-protein kinase At2g19130 n=1 Tax=Mangifera indica TaxID=29780 RepID=UPI001CFBE837|nr:G-type lectin S-receptor-like serine/threonine-protein kinase At2g19130 [Mangifera indica]
MDIKNNPWIMASALFICVLVKAHVSFGADTISANQSLSGDQTIVSGGGVFELGFFKPDGNLVLFNESGVSIWSTNLNYVTTSSIELEAVILDEGNLVTRDRSTNSSTPLWQSFDHPTHTWLPGMKFGRHKGTKVNQVLTSWKNKEDPASGLFSFELDPHGSDQYVLLWNNSEQYWRSGIWDGEIYSLVPEMTYLINNHMFNITHVSNENETYYMYSLTDSNTFKVMQFILDDSGQVHQMYWSEASNNWFEFWSVPRQICEVYAYCGAFGSCNERNKPFCGCLSGFKPNSEQNWYSLEDYSGGCVRKTQLQCENKSDRFLAIPKMVLPEHPQSVSVASIRQCEKTCLNDCSCTAYAYENNQCSIWIGGLINLRQPAQGDTNEKTIYIKLAASEFPRNKKVIVLCSVVGTAAFLVLLGLVVLLYLRKNKKQIKTTKAMEGSLVAFAYKDLQNATKNFSEKLGGGGFGSVFKGVLPNSSVIAVKKLEGQSQGEKQFRTEVSTVGSIQHVNLVRLLGFCSDGMRKLLVYDYMPNGSLDSHLFHEQALDWKARFKIALGTARGLVYLHEKCRDCIIHCDIKPENILVDAEFCPKVTDFGLAKLVGREFSRVLTTMRGTRGYLAPEWISGVAITAKADVYSYGMMLFEIVSGRRNSEQLEDGEVGFFPTLAARQISEGGDVLSLLDPRLKENADAEEISRILKVACWCIQDDETHRPSMSQVVKILEGLLDVTQSPIPRSLQVFGDNQKRLIFFTDSSSSHGSMLPLKNTLPAPSQAKNTTSLKSSEISQK